METVTDAPSAGVYKRVSANQIDPGDNPRPENEFDPEYITELAESFKAIGMLQAPLVRLGADGRYKLVAGECRVRGWKQAFGEDALLDVCITDKDEKAWLDAAALTENVLRKAMTPVSEAEGAARMLAHCNNDRDEAAKRLGWSRPTLDARLALMYAIPEVRKALHEEKIYLGHAELLATCRKEAQAKALGLLLAQPKMMPVSEFKAFLENAALVLDTAIFDKGECAGCHHNSSNQTAMFAEVISGGKCTNKSCYDGKTEAELEARKTRLGEDFQVVRIARPGENLTMTPLRAEGSKGVGAEQAKACRMCKDFGAVISAVPDKLGQEFRDMCLNVTCNVRMVAAAQKPQPKPDAMDAKAPDQSAKAGAARGSQSGEKPSGKATQSAPAKPVEPSTRIKEYREKLWRKIYQVVVPKLDVVANRSVLLALCLTKPSVIDTSGLQDDLKGSCKVDVMSKPHKVLRKVLEMDQKALGAAIGQIAAQVNAGMNGLDIEDVTGILKVFDVKVSDHWKIGKPFFELLTKNEIDAVCDEIGVKTMMGDKYGKAAKQSKDEYIDAILASGFDFVGRIPKLMTW